MNIIIRFYLLSISSLSVFKAMVNGLVLILRIFTLPEHSKYSIQLTSFIYSYKHFFYWSALYLTFTHSHNPMAASKSSLGLASYPRISDVQTGVDRDRNTNLLIHRWPTLPPELWFDMEFADIGFLVSLWAIDAQSISWYTEHFFFTHLFSVSVYISIYTPLLHLIIGNY